MAASSQGLGAERGPGDPAQLTGSTDPFLVALGNAYRRYERALLDSNRTDFAHLQRLVYDLLGDAGTADGVTRDLRYVLVAEYQDTNYIQEQLLLKLTEKSRNLCVVGDEDQSLYRFRGATVRNILEFPQRMPGCAIVKLTTNYRSHRAIVERYDRWMASIDWSNPHGPSFRHDKTLEPDAAGTHSAYPSVIAIWGRDTRDEAARFADLVEFLRKNEVIADYGQVALLLHSVRDDHSGPYLAALEAKGIPAFCPRARAYFEIPEVRDLVACFAVLFGWHGNGRGQVAGAVAELATYVDDAIVQLGRRLGAAHPLAAALQRWTGEIAALQEGEALDLRPAERPVHCAPGRDHHPHRARRGVRRPARPPGLQATGCRLRATGHGNNKRPDHERFPEIPMCLAPIVILNPSEARGEGSGRPGGEGGLPWPQPRG